MSHYSGLLNVTTLSLCIIFSVGCTLKASTESVTDVTTNFLSSTSSGAWFTVDGLLKSNERLNAFVVTNYDNLQQDLAKGEGEYLTSFVALVEPSTYEMSTSSTHLHLQERFQQIFDSTPVTPQTFISRLMR